MNEIIFSEILPIFIAYLFFNNNVLKGNVLLKCIKIMYVKFSLLSVLCKIKIILIAY